jgi:GNAT superfamily N-acetyltransferase
MADVRVEVVTADDRDDWLRLWRGWQEYMSGKVPEEISAATWAKFLEPGSGLDALIARNGTGEPLGFAAVSLTPFAWTASDILFLQDLYVEECARGQGIGSALLKGVYGFAEARGATQVFWMVDEGDPELQGFYDRHAIRTPYLRYMRGPWPW